MLIQNEKNQTRKEVDVRVVVHIPDRVRNMQERINTIYDILTRASQTKTPKDETCKGLGVAV